MSDVDFRHTQYPLDFQRDDHTLFPDSIVDLEGDVWLWTDSDKRGRPGYQWAGGTTCSRLSDGLGPAHIREYVETGLYRHPTYRDQW